MNTYHPISTYRLQFNRNFTLEDARRLSGYLRKLGIRTLYASPVTQAVSGSTHGYDVTDPTTVNREIGSEEILRRVIHSFHKRGIGWLQDLVPNHMAYSTENPWISDLLISGKASPWYTTFDIFRDHPEELLRERLMLPFFGGDAVDLIKNRELSLQFGENGLSLKYFNEAYPVSMEAYQVLITPGDKGAVPGWIRDMARRDLPAVERELRLGELVHAYRTDQDTKNLLDRRIDEVNRNQVMMKTLADLLSYLPVNWKSTEKVINYRRFFTINSLICINIQDRPVFEASHSKVLQWTNEGLVDGLRIDHIDGLYDPSGYLERLREETGQKIYIVVEKILEKKEELPVSWPVQGTTGYDFLAMVNNLLTNRKSGPEFYNFYQNWTGAETDPETLFLEKKRLILYQRLGGELDYLAHLCLSVGAFSAEKPGRKQMRRAIGAFMIHCPIYKYYNIPSRFTAREKKSVNKILLAALQSAPELNIALELLKRMFLLEGINNKEDRSRIDRFFRRMMQFTGPLMAKGLEDTAYYTFNPFIAHNEVGDSPGYFGIDTDAFHNRMKERSEHFPFTMNTTSTHDTKRGEDARARLNVLSDIPDSWKKAAGAWRSMNQELITVDKNGPAPTPSDEYMIYQALCGHMPMDGKPDESFRSRFKEYLLKALREGKENTSWSEPDAGYEKRVLEFTTRILDEDHPFLESLLGFTGTIIPHGIINSLTQLILKNTVPGVPDTFQGCETWNLSFVDPDNRRPVDYPLLVKNLDGLIRSGNRDPVRLLENLWKHPEDGRLKQWITHLSLQIRTKHEELFLKGSYVPLKVTGRYNSHLLAFYRNFRDSHLLVAVPLHTAAMPGAHGWEDTFIRLPDLSPFQWKCQFTGKTVETGSKIPVEKLFREFPFALLDGIPFQPEKRAGILMHLSSLPGDYGTGDMGRGATEFVDFLQRAGQRFWQILPLNVTGAETSYSPYSSRSAFAGNPTFIDPWQLVRHGLLEARHLKEFKARHPDKTDLPGAEKTKSMFLDTAFTKFKKSGPVQLQEGFDKFVNDEAYWLNDYVLFEMLKLRYPGQSWNRWPAKFRDRHDSALNEFRAAHLEEWERIAFGQFIFSEQWQKLKTYANDRGVDIFGDLPIYVDYESADVWAHPALFRLNPDKSMAAIAGVPPDYFNADGQRWGMPLYHWNAMEETLTSWWISRIRKNLQWFDLLRLDHFRGFSAYWEVEPGAKTARKGKWTPGPGARLFEAIQSSFPDMPFVAEDLGLIDSPVIELRNRFNLPGMKVIQFGFGDKMPFSTHNPGQINYNSIAYTGTHDNNTIRGWYREEADRKTLKRIKAFTGRKLKEAEAPMEMIRLVYASASRLVIIPMQDWLRLDEKARMNFPSTTKGNWRFRAAPEVFTPGLAKQIRKMVRTFGRY